MTLLLLLVVPVDSLPLADRGALPTSTDVQSQGSVRICAPKGFFAHFFQLARVPMFRLFSARIKAGEQKKWGDSYSGLAGSILATLLLTWASHVGPHDAVSNLSKWAVKLGLNQAPGWLSDIRADMAVFYIGLAMILFSVGSMFSSNPEQPGNRYYQQRKLETQQLKLK